MQEAQEAHIARTGDAHYQMFHLGVAHVGLPQLVRDGAIVLFALLSLKLTPKATRAANEFSWGPILEVAKLFAGIFACMLPAIAILKAGEHGALAGLVKSVTHPHHYFWATGGLSSFLDNAPTYLVFFETAQATPMDAFAARGAWGAVDPVSDKINMPSAILAAISAGAVFMGANSYIGNGPNFMVKAIADSDGVPMPSFFGYVFKWAVPFLIPCFILLTFLFFMPA
ncbi:MAG TPA: sodium:proton antiporter, partial [Planctomycetota bacterium]|nr:sodium:proton antiporter [Planctomycetota bacterium]